MAVARAIVEELVLEEEVPAELITKLVSTVDFYRYQHERERNDTKHGNHED